MQWVTSGPDSRNTHQSIMSLILYWPDQVQGPQSKAEQSLHLPAAPQFKRGRIINKDFFKDSILTSSFHSSPLRLVQITDCPRHLNQSNFIITFLYYGQPW